MFSTYVIDLCHSTLQLDVTESVAYFTLKLHSKRVFVSLTNEGELLVPSQVFADLQVAHASCPAVILVFFDHPSQSFEGYALLRELPNYMSGINSGPIPVEATLVRRASVKFSQVVHIRDDQGLRGRPLSAVRDGSRLGISAGRVLCRSIDKKAYHDDPVHYRDVSNFTRNVIPGQQPKVPIPNRADTDILNMNFMEYLEDFARRKTGDESVPSLDSLVYR